METAKQKAIREAYGEHWETFKDLIDENGFVKRGNYYLLDHNFSYEYIKENFYVSTEINQDKIFRPKSLKGIEYNNGWIKIDEKFDWGKDNCLLFFWDNEEKKIVLQLKFLLCGNQQKDYKLRFTHFKEISYPEPPIY